MAKVKILKKARKSKCKLKKNPNFKPVSQPQDKFKDKYLEFYDDIKIPSKRYDW